MNDRQNLAAITGGLVLTVLLAAVVVAYALLAPVPPPRIIEVDVLTCPADAHARTWYGFDTSYTLAVCYRGDRAIGRDEREQLTCKHPMVATATPTGAECVKEA